PTSPSFPCAPPFGAHARDRRGDARRTRLALLRPPAALRVLEDRHGDRAGPLLRAQSAVPDPATARPLRSGADRGAAGGADRAARSEEHTSELQSRES